MKKIICICCAVFLLFSNPVFAENGAPETSAKSVLLMEQSTGNVLYEKNADEQLPIASVTKIMTMLLICEAIDGGKITMEDMVPVSEKAMSMGGSTMFLDAGEELSVYEILKGIAVASANDGCVAMGEYLSGSTEAFVAEMNKRASELGMSGTNFLNTNGLDEDGHCSTARDVALMSRELLRHEEIFQFTTIWTDKMHNGQYDLANTNKLIRFYPGANGLKTGSTSKAKCCISAAAKRDDMQLIAVVLGAETSNDRFSDARALLDYGFANYAVDKLAQRDNGVGTMSVKRGVKDSISVCPKQDFSYLVPKGKKGSCETELFLPESIKAPIEKGQVVGNMVFKFDGNEIGEVELTAGESVAKKSLTEIIGEFISGLFC